MEFSNTQLNEAVKLLLSRDCNPEVCNNFPTFCCLSLAKICVVRFTFFNPKCKSLSNYQGHLESQNSLKSSNSKAVPGALSLSGCTYSIYYQGFANSARFDCHGSHCWSLARGTGDKISNEPVLWKTFNCHSCLQIAWLPTSWTTVM